MGGCQFERRCCRFSYPQSVTVLGLEVTENVVSPHQVADAGNDGPCRLPLKELEGGRHKGDAAECSFSRRTEESVLEPVRGMQGSYMPQAFAS